MSVKAPKEQKAGMACELVGMCPTELTLRLLSSRVGAKMTGARPGANFDVRRPKPPRSSCSCSSSSSEGTASSSSSSSSSEGTAADSEGSDGTAADTQDGPERSPLAAVFEQHSSAACEAIGGLDGGTQLLAEYSERIRASLSAALEAFVAANAWRRVSERGRKWKTD